MTRFQQVLAVVVLVVGYGIVGRMDHEDESSLAEAAWPPTLHLVCHDADAPAPDGSAERSIDRPKPVFTAAPIERTRLSCVVVTQ